jgi:transposase
MLVPQYDHDIPEMTKAVAEAAFPKGNKVMKIREVLGIIFNDADFQDMFPRLGQPAESPGKLALVTILQYVENLTDRDAADAVRGRIDWKYLLGLELTDAGFHYSVLSEFRQRLVSSRKEGLLLEKVIQSCAAQGLLGGKKKQRTDSTHVLAKIRLLNRVELVGETMRRALNEIAQEAPEWLTPLILPEWGKRYSHKIDTSRLGKTKQRELVKAIGEDGHYLLAAIYAKTTPPAIKALKSVATLRAIWVQQYYRTEEEIVWRERKSQGMPPASKMITSPDEPDARYAVKGSTSWTGYKVHLTETCDDQVPHLITHVETTIAPVPDMVVTSKIEQDLAAKDLQPTTHFCDGAYVDVENMANAQKQGIDLIGPVHQDSSWQAQAQTGYDLSNFVIDWKNMTATCPEGETSSYWKKRTNIYGKPDFRFEFRFQTCHVCTARVLCTRAKKYGRQLTVYPQQFHEILVRARERQKTEAFKKLYNKRAGIEGTISQTVSRSGMRRARFRGLKKTHLQHLATAAAINLQRVAAWLLGDKPETTRTAPFAALAASC